MIRTVGCTKASAQLIVIPSNGIFGQLSINGESIKVGCIDDYYKEAISAAISDGTISNIEIESIDYDESGYLKPLIKIHRSKSWGLKDLKEINPTKQQYPVAYMQYNQAMPIPQMDQYANIPVPQTHPGNEYQME
eukprot:TRINITY_DN2563_c0_g2_i1.p2 TRINITY_DN2563_c0_g2~~TRINITY_DN2563_c0_g2_i1.p2  ORF type:complete len:135 (-),score=25.98 TRINITY_DN2563_c0_g2_i1:88-492(-)